MRVSASLVLEPYFGSPLHKDVDHLLRMAVVVQIIGPRADERW